MQWPVPCTASSYLKAVTVHKKESNSESSVFRWEKEKLCAGLTREIKSQKSSKNHQKKAVKEKVDVRMLADDTSPDEWMDGRIAPWKERKSHSNVSLWTSLEPMTTPGWQIPDTALKIHLLGTERPRRCCGCRVLPPHTGQRKLLLEQQQRIFSLHSLLGQGFVSILQSRLWELRGTLETLTHKHVHTPTRSCFRKHTDELKTNSVSAKQNGLIPLR